MRLQKSKAFQDKIKTKKITRKDSHIQNFYNAFVYQPQYKQSRQYFQQKCIVNELLGYDLNHFNKKYKYQGIPIKMAQSIIKQILQGLLFIHEELDSYHGNLCARNVMAILSSGVQYELDKFQQTNFKKKDKYLDYAQFQVKELYPERYLIRDLHFLYTDSEEEEEINRYQIRKLNLNDRDKEENLILTLEDLEQELERLVKEKNIKDKKERKNLRKKLKKKMKKHQKRANQATDNQNKKLYCKNIRKKRKFASDNIRLTVKLRNNIMQEEPRWPSPEQILHNDRKLDEKKNDIWSLGCLVFEILTGCHLFQSFDSQEQVQKDFYLLQIAEMFNNFEQKDQEIIDQYVMDLNEDIGINLQYDFQSIEEILIQNLRAIPEEVFELMKFLKPMFEIDPRKRPKIQDLFKHPWLNRNISKLYLKENESIPQYNKVQVNRRFYDENSFMGEFDLSSEESSTHCEYPDFYQDVVQDLDSSFKDNALYCNHVDNFDSQDNTGNYIFDKKFFNQNLL